MTFDEQVKDKATRDFIKDNMVIVELGQYDLIKKNYPPKNTITGLYWDDYDPKDSYYYFIKDLKKTDNGTFIVNDSLEIVNSNINSLNVEPSSSGFIPEEFEVE